MFINTTGSNAHLYPWLDKQLTLQQIGQRAAAAADRVEDLQRADDAVARGVLVQRQQVTRTLAAEQAVSQGQVGSGGDPNLRLLAEAIAAMPEAAESVRQGKVKALDALVGQVMRKTRGQARPDLVRRLLLEALGVG